MTLKEANKELKQLDNEYTYWLNEKELLESLVIPQAVDTTKEKVEGGRRVDRMLKYVETEDIKQINATLDYIFKRRKNLMEYIDRELRIIGEYEPLERKIILLRNEKHMKWDEIAIIVGYCKRQCQRIYDKYYQRTTKRRSRKDVT